MIWLTLRWLSRHLVGVLLVTALAGLGTAGIAVNRWLHLREARAVEADRAERRIADLEAEIADLEAEIAARAEAARIVADYTRQLQDVAAERAELIRDLTTMEGLDAPLSDPAADVARRLWQ